MDSFTIKNIFLGNMSPTYWKTILQYSNEIEKNHHIRYFPSYVLKTFFIQNKDTDLCFHYKPKKTRSNKDESTTYTKDLYRGFANTNKDIWVANANIIKVTDEYLIIKDKSKKNKRIIKKDNTEFYDHPIKKLLIDRIVDITEKDNAPIDFSKNLKFFNNTNIVNKKTHNKNYHLKKMFHLKKEVRAQKMPSEPQKQNSVINIKPIKTTPEATPMENLATVHENTKKRLEDYWSYLDNDYARAMTKDY